MNREERLINLPSVTWPLVCFVLWVLVTAKMTGGIGFRALGSEIYGGKRYFFIFAAVLGYFALSMRPISDPRKQLLYPSLYFVSGISAVLSNVAYALGPAFYFLFYLFPVEWAMQQATADYVAGMGGFVRVAGLAPGATAVFCFLLLRYGITGLLDIKKPWRLALFAITIFTSMFAGFRSSLIFFGVILVVQFFLEGLAKTKVLPLTLIGLILGSICILPVLDRLPLSVQRSLSFLPLNVDPMVRRDAEASLHWRFEMWQVVSREIPKYLWIGKGYALNPTDVYLSEEAVRRGFYKDYEPSLLAGDYHNGPLSIIIPFGILGVVFFIWFSLAAFRVLYANYRFSPSSLQSVNTFLFTYFIARWIFHVFFFGAISLDLWAFCGVLGMSVSLNGGMLRALSPFEVRTETLHLGSAQAEPATS
ncbi:MAG: O-antigen ligase family protein [Verrucomicrobiota bacterium]